MDKPAKTSIAQKKIEITFFHPENVSMDFLPWGKGERGSHFFLKLKRKNEMALLYGGSSSVQEAEIQKVKMKLMNDGWDIEGEVSLEFDGRSEEEKEIESLFKSDPIRLEIGRKLLPLVDPGAGSPLTQVMPQIRKDIAQSTGFVIPGIRIKDNLNIPYDSYIIYLKEAPIGTGEIFLDKFLAIGNREALSQLKGWSVKDPVFQSPALWIEPAQRGKAEELGCLVMGPLNVLTTHLRETIERNVGELLGIQDVYRSLTYLKETHPLLVEDFLKDKKKLRYLKKILQNLLAERVSIKDMATIVETVTDYEEELEKTDIVTEMVRISLSRQICWSYINAEGKLVALSLSPKMEKKIQSSIKKTKVGLRLVLSEEEADLIISHLRKVLQDYKNPRVIFCDPPTRLYFRRLVERAFPDLAILSTAEIPMGIPIEIVGEVDLPPSMELPKENKEEEKKEEEKKEGVSFLGIRL